MLRIRKTKKIDRIGLIRAARKFGIAPLFTDQLQRGEVIEIEDEKAQALIDRGYALRAGGRQPANEITVDDTEMETTETAGDHCLADDDDKEPESDESDTDDVRL